MAFFSIVFFVFVGSILALVIGMFKPKIVLWWKEAASRRDVFKIYLSLVFVSFIGMAVFAPEVQDYKKDQQEVLKLLNMSYQDLFQAEKEFEFFQKSIDSDIYDAIAKAKSNEPVVMKLAYKVYQDDFTDEKTEEVVEKYVDILHNSNLFLQMIYNDFLDYVDNKKPTLVVKMKENIQNYQTLKMQAVAHAFTLGRKYQLAYDQKTETWKEKKNEEDK